MSISENIISKSIIKPSSPTPNSLRNHKLNFLDQVTPLMYMPYVFFYQYDDCNHEQHVQISQLLRESLSQILTLYYPLAGRIKENLFIDCNDTGVEFVEARVHACIARFNEEDPQMEELKCLIPVNCIFHSADDAVLKVKVSFLDCGGIAIGMCLSHKVGDLLSMVMFMNAWSAKCRGETQIIQPCFDLAERFPPKDSIPYFFNPSKEKTTMNKLIFDNEMLGRLKKQAASDEVKNPTTMEALSIFVWQNFIEATKTILGDKNPSPAILHAVNLRPRTVPPMPNNVFGNCSIISVFSTHEGADKRYVLSKIRASIRAIDENYIKNLTADKYLKMLNEVSHLFVGANSCHFTGSQWFPVYDIDFGWGKPVWVCPVKMPYNNTVNIMSTPSKDGIEARIIMPDDFFQILKTNYRKLHNQVTSIDLDI